MYAGLIPFNFFFLMYVLLFYFSIFQLIGMELYFPVPLPSSVASAQRNMLQSLSFPFTVFANELSILFSEDMGQYYVGLSASLKQLSGCLTV